MWSKVSLSYLLALCFVVASQEVITVGNKDELLSLLASKKIALTPAIDLPVPGNFTQPPQEVTNNTVDYRESAVVRRDTSWGRWGNLEMIMRWSTYDFKNSWNNRIRNEVADQAANRGWQAWWGWTAMRFHAQYAGGLKRDESSGFEVILPGILEESLDITMVDNAAYTYVYDPATATFGIQTVRQSYMAESGEQRKRQRNQPAFNMAFTKIGGPSCGADYSNFYSAAYHAAYTSMGTGVQMCGFFSACCNNGCEAMQFQASNYRNGEWDLWGNCMDINRNAQWYNYGFF